MGREQNSGVYSSENKFVILLPLKN